jgi:hypothetical protein
LQIHKTAKRIVRVFAIEVAEALGELTNGGAVTSIKLVDVPLPLREHVLHSPEGLLLTTHLLPGCFQEIRPPSPKHTNKRLRQEPRAHLSAALCARSEVAASPSR